MPDKKKKTILLIEDDPDQVFLYSTKFKLEGLKIWTKNLAILARVSFEEAVKKLPSQEETLALYKKSWQTAIDNKI